MVDMSWPAQYLFLRSSSPNPLLHLIASRLTWWTPKDDGTTRNYALGQVATQTFEMQSHEDGSLQFLLASTKGNNQKKDMWKNQTRHN